MKIDLLPWNTVKDAFPHPYSSQDGEEWIALNQFQDPAANLSISLDGQVIGGIGIVLKTDVYRKSGEIGYWLGEPFWNRGISSEAVRLFTTYCFSHFDLERLFAGVFQNNLPSMRVLEKNGFRREAIHRSAIFKNNQLLDEHIFVKFRI
jgi:[ribosomal protein S5]-alanine N-acetyltransferase